MCPIKRIARGGGKEVLERNGPDRKRKLEVGCLAISVRAGGPRSLCFGRFPVGVSIYKGGSDSHVK